MLRKIPVRETTADPKFAEHCSKLVCSVCSVCGGTKLKAVDIVNNKARCLNSKCDGAMGGLPGQAGIVALAPSMEAIWGAQTATHDNTVLAGGTGEQSNGVQSASGFRWELFRKAPKGCKILEKDLGRLEVHISPREEQEILYSNRWQVE